MSRPKNTQLKTVEEMATELSESKSKSGYSKKIYKAESDEHKGEVLSNDIQNHITELTKSRQKGKVNFFDLEEVERRTIEYLTACSISETFPSVMGLSVQAYGVSRQALNQYLNSHDNEVTAYINIVKDMIADILTNASLYNNANATQVIFQLKNHFGHSDVVEMDVKNNKADIYKNVIPADELIRRAKLSEGGSGEAKKQLTYQQQKVLERIPNLDLADEPKVIDIHFDDEDI